MLDATTLNLSWPVLAAAIAVLLVVIVASRHLARPRVKASFGSADSRRHVRTLRGQCGEALPMRFRVRLRRLSSRRGATEIELDLHFIMDIVLHLARYGPTQQLTGREVRRSKGPSRMVTVSGIKVDKWEPTPFEDLEAWVTIPRRQGKYLAWITAYAPGGAGGIGISRFVINVSDGAFTARKISYLGTWRLRAQRWIVSPSPSTLPPFPSLMRATWD